MLHLIIDLALVGFIVWLIVTYIPMPDVIKKVIVVIVAICMILYLLQAFGIGDLAVPRIK